MSDKKIDILIATENQGKAKEIKEIFSDTNYNTHFLFEFKDKIKNLSVQENAKDFEGNALIKAIIIGDELRMITLADDSGICINALQGKPGVYSARYSAEKTDSANNQKVLEELKDVPMEKRTAYYNCTVAVYDPETKFVETVSGQWHGRIAMEPRGTKSFGYAPLFLFQEANFEKTNAEMEPQELIGINHRGKAFRQAIRVLDEYFKNK